MNQIAPEPLHSLSTLAAGFSGPGGWTRAATALAAAGAVLFALTLLAPGCGSVPAPDPPEEGAAPFVGPRLTISSSGPEHVVQFQAPSPGYEGMLDHVANGPRGKQIFVTIRKPDPAYVYSTVIVDSNIGTGVPSDEPVELFAREVEHSYKGPLEGYAPVRPLAGAPEDSPGPAGSPAPESGPSGK